MQQQETKKTRRIRQVSVTNLFGIFNHVIPLKMDEHITIIHGPNGFGKTMMLKLLYTLFCPVDQLSQNYQVLQRIPFDQFRVDFEDNTSFWVSKLAEDGHRDKPEIVFHATDKLPSTLLLRKNISSSLIRRFVPSLIRVEADLWEDPDTGEFLSLDDVIERFSIRVPKEHTIIKTSHPWLAEMRNSIPIRFIETQRLLSSNSPRSSEYTVKKNSKHLVGVIKEKLAESAEDNLSQALDSTLPARLISPTLTQHLQATKDELIDKLQKLEQKRSHLMTIGLIDKQTGTRSPIVSDQETEGTEKVVLAVYVDNTERQLGFFDDLAKKIDLLTTIINDLFLFKTMTINKEQGFVFTTKNGTNLPLEDLSSGEQHELVLFYDLLFRTTPGSLILIDEPDLSLHVVWQEKFMGNLQQIKEFTDIDVIIATHSPDIIGDRGDLTVRLKWPDGNGGSQ